MKRLALLFLLLTTTFSVLQAQTKYYVKATAAGDGSGTDWDNASGDLQDVINNAAANDSIFVAKGSYLPNRKADAPLVITSDDRDNAFVLKKDVKIYGGFAGGEASLSERNLKAGNESILSGNLGDPGDSTDNAYHVVISAGDIGTAALNGFAIQDGNADGVGQITVNSQHFYKDRSGGVAVVSSSPVITNVIIRGNRANYVGGGMGISLPPSSPAITNVVISGNSSQYGGGIFCESSSPVLTNVTISGNNASVSIVEGAGGGIWIIGSSPVLRNSIIYGNSPGIGIATNDGSVAAITYSLIQGLANTDNGNINPTVNNHSPLFVNPLPTPGRSNGGDYHLKERSTGINAANNDYYSADSTPGLHLVSTDLGGNIRIQKGTVDMGAYESDYNLVTNNPDANGIIYVDGSKADNPLANGSSWDLALASLGEALTIADTINRAATMAADSVRQIWVTGGTYHLFSQQSFEMVPGVKIYGGFTGTEGSLADRRLSSGDTSILLGNGANVIRNDGNGLDSTALLDGFKITGGNTNGEFSLGGGIYNNEASPTLSHLTISGNNGYNGGGMCNNASSPVLTNIVFSGNVADLLGGGICNISSSPVLINVTITNNTGLAAGGMANNSSSPTLTNSILWGNKTGVNIANEIYNAGNSSMTLHHSLYSNEADDLFEDAANTIIASDTLTANPQFVDSANGNYQLQSTSPAINAGDNTALSVNDTLDLAGNPRIFGTAIDMGAYENQDPVALPVTIQHFTGMLQSGVASLQWQSGVESNFNHFELEKSIDGKLYNPIATVAAKGNNSSYTYSAPQQEASAMYRLKWTDDNGHSAYYNQIVLLTQGGAATGILVYPNPAKDYIHIRAAAAGSVSIYDAAGRLVKTQALSAGVNNMDIHRLVAGMYYAVVNGQQIQFVKH